MPMLNEDIYRLICHELAQRAESLVSLACASRLLATICRGHIFGRMKLDIHRGQDFMALDAIIARDPALSTAIRQLTLFDDGTPPLPQFFDTGRGEHPLLFTTDGYTILTNDSSYFSHLVRRLSNVQSIQLSLKYTFATSSKLPLQWDQLSSSFKQLIYRPEVRNVNLEGIRNIPIDVSTMFLTKHSLRLSRCTYECDSIVTVPSRRPASNFKVNLSKLIHEWIGLEEASSVRGEVTTILYHWIYMYNDYDIPLPSIDSLDLSLACWASISEAETFLRVFQNSIRSLSLNTTKLHLEALQILNFHIPAREGQLPPSHVHAFPFVDVPALIAEGQFAYPDGWAAFELEPVSLRSTSAPAVHCLDYHVKQWAADPTKRGNGELVWVVNMLNGLPAPRALALESLSLAVEVGGHMHPEADVCNLLQQLAEEAVWAQLSTALWRPDFGALRTVRVTLVLPCALMAKSTDLLWSVMYFIRLRLLWQFPRRSLQVLVDAVRGA